MFDHAFACLTTKKTLAEFLPEMRTLIATMASDSQAEVVKMTMFMESLCLGVARTKVVRVRPSTVEEAVKVALNSKFNLQSARLGVNGQYPRSSSSSGLRNVPESMGLSHTESSEAKLHAAEEYRSIRCVWET
jgi:hypothetical protein